MPEIETQRADLRNLTGLHLWHAGLSNCSQRVRLVLEEKALPWVSHPINLMRFEHASPDYEGIHPKGLVPALVHDGRTFIDSTDIITYLNDAFPEPPLAATEHQVEVAGLLTLANESQLALRTLSHEFLLGDQRRYDAAALDDFERRHVNSEFATFLREFAAGFSDDRLLNSFQVMDLAVAKLDAHLADRTWLAGGHLSLADFCWLPNIHRLALFEFPLARYAHLTRWFEALKARASYRGALTSHEGGLSPPSPRELLRREQFFSRALSKHPFPGAPK